MPWRIRWERRALKDMSKLGAAERYRIARFLNDRLASRANPRELGEALTGPFAGQWKYRVGDYRIIAVVEDAEITIAVIRIGDRKEIYR